MPTGHEQVTANFGDKEEKVDIKLKKTLEILNKNYIFTTLSCQDHSFNNVWIQFESDSFLFLLELANIVRSQTDVVAELWDFLNFKFCHIVFHIPDHTYIDLDTFYVSLKFPKVFLPMFEIILHNTVALTKVKHKKKSDGEFIATDFTKYFKKYEKNPQKYKIVERDDNEERLLEHFSEWKIMDNEVMTKKKIKDTWLNVMNLLALKQEIICSKVNFKKHKKDIIGIMFEGESYKKLVKYALDRENDNLLNFLKCNWFTTIFDFHSQQQLKITKKFKRATDIEWFITIKFPKRFFELFVFLLRRDVINV
jgi:hypothetical protein